MKVQTSSVLFKFNRVWLSELRIWYLLSLRRKGSRSFFGSPSSSYFRLDFCVNTCHTHHHHSCIYTNGKALLFFLKHCVEAKRATLFHLSLDTRQCNTLDKALMLSVPHYQGGGGGGGGLQTLDSVSHHQREGLWTRDKSSRCCTTSQYRRCIRVMYLTFRYSECKKCIAFMNHDTIFESIFEVHKTSTSSVFKTRRTHVTC